MHGHITHKNLGLLWQNDRETKEQKLSRLQLLVCQDYHKTRPFLGASHSKLRDLQQNFMAIAFGCRCRVFCKCIAVKDLKKWNLKVTMRRDIRKCNLYNVMLLDIGNYEFEMITNNIFWRQIFSHNFIS